MDKRRDRRAIEMGKSLLIVLLACSALWLAARTQLVGPLHELLSEEDPQIQLGQTQTQARAEAARPLRIMANLANGPRYGVQYDAAAGDALFQKAAALLVETMSSAAQPERVSRRQWEQALTEGTGICFDFQGEIPMRVLSGWLSGEAAQQDATVRRLALSVWRDSVVLYYRDEGDGSYYRCRSEVVEAARLEEALSGLTDNGAFYAFEAEEYGMLDPDTMLLSQTPAPGVYASANPVASGQAVLEELAEELDFAINPNGIYYAGEWVARSGNDTLRLSDQGVLSYLMEEGGGEHFPISGQGTVGELFDAVEGCRQLAVQALGSRCGEAGLYLMSAAQADGGWEIDFGYSLNGIPVRLEQGCAARFLVRDGQIAQFAMQFRSYTHSGANSALLPERQAAAALEAMGLAGEELTLIYTDRGGDTLMAGWAAADRGPEGE